LAGTLNPDGTTTFSTVDPATGLTNGITLDANQNVVSVQIAGITTGASLSNVTGSLSADGTIQLNAPAGPSLSQVEQIASNDTLTQSVSGTDANGKAISLSETGSGAGAPPSLSQVTLDGNTFSSGGSTSFSSFVTANATPVENAAQSASNSATTTTLTQDQNDINNNNTTAFGTDFAGFAQALMNAINNAGTDNTQVTADQTADQQDVTTGNNIVDPGADPTGGGGSGPGGSDPTNPDPTNPNPIPDDPPPPPDDPPIDPPDLFGPLVLGTNGHGINLVPFGQSSAQFDVTGGGTKVQTGWIGAGTGLLVLDANGNGVIDNGTELIGNNFAGNTYASGFAALATLDSNHDGVINASDAAFAQLKVWVDANGDGVTQPGELLSLSQLGIQSINLSSTAASETVGGNLVTAVGSLAFANGTTEAIDDVTFATAPTAAVAALNGTSATALGFLQQAQRDLPAQAQGAAAAAAATVFTAIQSLASPDGVLANDEAIAVKKFGSQTLSNGSVFVVPAGGQPTALSGLATVRTADSTTASALQTLDDAAQDFKAAAGDQVTSETAAITANIENAVLGSADDVAAAKDAATTEGAWQPAFARLVQADTALQNASSALGTAQSFVQSTVLANGTKFATTADAKEAEDAAAEQKASAEALAIGEVALQSLLKAAAVAWDLSQATLVEGGQTITAQNPSIQAVPPPSSSHAITVALSGGGLVVAGDSETLSDGVTPSTYAILQGTNVTINGFLAGTLGSRLDFLGGAQNATLSQSTSNGTTSTVITDGTATVTLTGVSIAQLSLYDNLAGVQGVHVSGNNLTASQDLGESLIDDGTSHIRAITADGNDTVTGGAGNDVLTSLGGGTFLIGGGGNDTYQYGAGDGVDVVVNGLPTNSGPSGNLVLNGLALANVWFRQSGNDLLINGFGSSDQIDMRGWFGNVTSQLQAVTFDDGTLFTNSEIATLIADDLSFVPNGTFNSAGTTLAGSGRDFLGTGQTDQFIRTSTGELAIFQFNSSNQLTARLWLNSNGGPYAIDGSTTVAGVGANFFGDAQRNLFLRESNGQIGVLEINTSGEVFGTAELVVPPSSGGASKPFTIDTGTTVVGAGQNFFGQGEREIFLRDHRHGGIPLGQSRRGRDQRDADFA